LKSKYKPGDALLVVDIQYDFLPGGALAVADGDKILPVVNTWIDEAGKNHIPIFASRDWHPTNHISFKERGGPWPPHCIQNTKGAKFHHNLKLPADTIIINKAFTADKDAYSAMEGVLDKDAMSLPEKLKALNIKRLWIVGLAFDYCVHYSALEARKLGYDVAVVLAGCRAISPETEQSSFKDMANAGVELELDSQPY
jgi:nicotinamidase/pyrazinamidase